MDNSNKIVLKREHTYVASDEDDGLLGFDDHADDTSYNGESTRKGSHYFRWTPTGINLLLKLRFEKEHEFNHRTRPKKNLWNEIANGMKQYGNFIISGEHCDLKFRNMMQTYKKNRLKEEKGKIDFINWEYYKHFKEYVGNSDRKLNTTYESNTEETDEVSNDVTIEANKTNKNDETKINETATQTRSSKALRTEEKNTTTTQSIESRLPAKRKRISKDVEKITTPPEEEESCIEATSSKVTPQNNITEIKFNCSQRTMSSNELNDCKTFGESVGVQMTNIENSWTRSLVKLKIQKILFLAETGKLDKYNNKGESCDSDF